MAPMMGGKGKKKTAKKKPMLKAKMTGKTKAQKKTRSMMKKSGRDPHASSVSGIKRMKKKK